ncbi:SHOCT domain-containing protein [Evansella cellulosilytica]|uniref:SHOCT domain-containing protein n=1 Tax=Evansella cellulosilytica (strain ATCC 21833 / DSM 2522 / FERM P-1141 / JCM 9156 / N-4) TaxID=649639 RepID=E6TVK9_EVAC2|nr:SHOCT domain-containing protein [Evansella cellulosilytica]ADU32137.1 hypothetical protein Bcell_3900 [Evansella cellulosilytica DSM 2522]
MIIGCFILFLIGFFVLMMFQVSTGAGVISLIIVVISMTLLVQYTKKFEKEEKEAVEKKEIDVNKEVWKRMGELEFSISQRYDDVLHEDRYKFIAVDEKAKKVALVENGNYRIFGYRDILKSQIVEDGQEITTTSRTSQIGRALVGGVLAGGVGAIIGGGGGKQKHTSEVKQVSLKIVVNDTKIPTFTLDFLKLDVLENHVTKDSEKYTNAIKVATNIHDLISVLIRQADEEDKATESQKLSEGEKTISLADELEKLSKLVEKGIITSEEFEKQKNKLLND